MIEIEINNYEESFKSIAKELRNDKPIENISTGFNSL